ncbi:MAG: acyl-CoA dehydrogenase [Candidatus Thermoplasmatota archaeon]|nr:acyl-CoA dehydrogenase [Candidatus Thermoplasmatota archaeon]
MEFGLAKEHRLLRQMVAEFADGKVAPKAHEYDEAEEFPKDLVEMMYGLGLMGMMVPEAYGGGGMDTIGYCIAMEEINRADASLGTIMSVNNSLVCDPILRYGTEEQKEELLPKLAQDGWLGAYALTEPWSGSDAGAMRSTARLGGDEWVLNGQKIFVTNAWHSQIIISYAKTDPKAPRSKGITAFIIPTDTPGLHKIRKEKKMGIRATDTTALAFEECRIPKENLLGKVDEGFKVALSTLDGGRIGIASQALGIARAAYEASLQYAQEREQFGQTIGQFQAIQWKLADMATEVDAARLLIYSAAYVRDSGRRYTKEAAIAKLFASDLAVRASREAVQIYGGYGYLRDFPVERLYRDAKITEIYEGTSEIQRVVIARQLLREDR